MRQKRINFDRVDDEDEGEECPELPALAAIQFGADGDGLTDTDRRRLASALGADTLGGIWQSSQYRE